MRIVIVDRGGFTPPHRKKSGILFIGATSTTNHEITGVADIKATTIRTQTGLAKINGLISTRTITGLANIKLNTVRSQTGESSIFGSVTETITGISHIANPDAQVAQVSRELQQKGGDPDGRSCQVSRELFQVNGDAKLHSEQVAREIISNDFLNEFQVEQFARELLEKGEPPAQLGQVTRELHQQNGDPRIKVDQVVREILFSSVGGPPPPLPGVFNPHYFG